jgi:hypothetical protein
MLVINGLAIFVAAFHPANRKDQGYTLVFFGRKLRQNWAARSDFCPAASFVFSSVAEDGGLGMWKRHPCR